MASSAAQPRRDEQRQRQRKERDLRAWTHARASCLEDRHRRESTQPVGAGREYSADAVEPALPCADVVDEEDAITQEGLDTRPLVPRGERGPEVSPGLDALGLATPGLREYGAASKHAPACARALGRAFGFNGADAVPELRSHLSRCPKRWRYRQRELDGVRHRAVAPKEVPRPGSAQASAREERRQAVDAGPVVDALDEVVEDGVGRDVHQLVDHGLAVDEPDDAGLLGRPEVLPTAAQGVLAARKELVEMLDELGIPAGPVEDHGVVVVAHRARQDHVDVAAHGGVDEAVEERVVGRVVWPQQELALGAATRDQVELAG